jgi:hypothetical protein
MKSGENMYQPFCPLEPINSKKSTILSITPKNLRNLREKNITQSRQAAKNLSLSKTSMVNQRHLREKL